MSGAVSGGHTDDRRWWWDGFRWLPAVSPDGRAWFDGQRWVATPASPVGRRRAPTPRWLPVAVLLWTVTLSLPPAVALVTLKRDGGSDTSPGVATLLLALTGVALLATAVLGFLMRRLPARPQLLTVAAVGTAVLAGWYAAAWFTSGSTDPSRDNAAGAGLVVLAVPAFTGLTALLGAGCLLGRLPLRRAAALPTRE